VDPGETNIIQAHVYHDGQLVAKFSLTRGQYYADSMLDYSTERWKKWNKHPILKNLIEGGSTHHFKKANIDDIATSIRYYQSVRADIRVYKLTWGDGQASPHTTIVPFPFWTRPQHQLDSSRIAGSSSSSSSNSSKATLKRDAPS